MESNKKKRKRRSSKKKTRRSDALRPDLDHTYLTKNRREYVDYDYIDDLPDDLKDYMNDFTAEFYSASVKGSDRLNENRFHNTEKLKKSVTDANNARNRDMYGIAKASNLVHDDSRPENDTKILNYDLFEQAVIAEVTSIPITEEDQPLNGFLVFYNAHLNKLYISKALLDEETDIFVGEF